ncbi:protein phosphatase CheZ [Desulfurispira natronophila]|uniref:Chemotaxis regulatin CheY-phosphate phosphatase CheZ n=1 Tax=Desulfurispira natronophila TaxID=682562 RepID=A0A7W7Y3R2_9BACT|nr:protein phosphatase CheZ [Desulfurispira natronophila]MBB5021384.1 chemotaxis regulatin CheY-phosphate phosphatase CheZ [Desulfurispira natronophila]
MAGKADQSDIDALLAQFEDSDSKPSDEQKPEDYDDIESLMAEVDAAENESATAASPPKSSHGSQEIANPLENNHSTSDNDSSLETDEVGSVQEAEESPHPDEPADSSAQELPKDHEEILNSVCHLDESPTKRKTSSPGTVLPEPDHHIIDRLDEITAETESKTNEVMDKLDAAIEKINQMSEDIDHFAKLLDRHERVIEMLSSKHPDNPVVKFLRDFTETLEQIEQIKTTAEQCQDDIFVAMDLLQFQDISRQKIEKVIAVIRALNSYLNTWFGSSKPESSRASVAKTFGKDDSGAASDDDIEALIGSFQEKG